MKRKNVVAAILLAVAISGCGDGDIVLVPAGGTVRYKGQPVPGAAVTFVSETNPLAAGTTNDQGEFELNTLGRPGAAVGSYTISVIALQDSREITPNEAQSMSTAELNKIRKSLIPEKYGHPRTSGLTLSVSEDETTNRFSLELSD